MVTVNTNGIGSRLRRISAFALGSVVLLLWPSPAATAQAPQTLRLSTVEQIAEDFAVIPCKNRERLNAVQGLFEGMEAGPTDISIQKSRDTENIVIRRQSASTDTIVIGAHYDLVERGCGAVDNWSGVVVLAHLYRTIRDLAAVNKNVVFVAFDKEELGLKGSDAMVAAIPRTEIPHYCAMINIDSFGLAGPFALEHVSSPKLVQLATEMADVLAIPFYKASIGGADTDSTSFRRRGIPAVTLSGLSNKWESIIHTNNDQVKAVIPVSVYLGYRLALAIWHRIDQAPCDAYK
jgi:acetylornithine deacetylase/succinyl-diaminopimelate desuccinylase-like protein